MLLNTARTACSHRARHANPYFRKHGTGGVTQPGQGKVNEATSICSSRGSASAPTPSRSPHLPPPSHAYIFANAFLFTLEKWGKGCLGAGRGVLQGGGCSAEGRRVIFTIYNTTCGLGAEWVFNQIHSRQVACLGDPITWCSQWEGILQWVSEKQELHSELFYRYTEQIFLECFLSATQRGTTQHFEACRREESGVGRLFTCTIRSWKWGEKVLHVSDNTSGCQGNNCNRVAPDCHQRNYRHQPTHCFLAVPVVFLRPPPGTLSKAKGLFSRCWGFSNTACFLIRHWLPQRAGLSLSWGFD